MKKPAAAGLAAVAVCAVLAGTASLPALGQPQQDRAGDDIDAHRNYVLHCMGCHGPNGDGVPGKIPPLKGALGLFIRSEAGRQFIVRVPGASTSALSDGELAAVTNMMLVRFNAKELSPGFVPYTEAEVARVRRPAFQDVATVRHGVIEELRRQGIPLPFGY
ncbi:c-type cytochrome [Cupriavidus numazuensis]|uniref:Cytochrome c domain-containing protein n=1 Tax=Cupriavidus numazuensis TaxID=221992 RepID=A0ABN7Q4P9_9BURK|nr:cytochrome c [Cupriavidus numazuensis]CAG2152318.1 hypothetical protein LMG26411_04161 [Cupriavidus numazuensis]